MRATPDRKDIAPILEDLYQNHTCNACHDLAGEYGDAVENGISISPEVMARAIINIYGVNNAPLDVRREIEPHLFAETKRIFDLAASKGFAKAHYNPTGNFARQISRNNAVFSAFRVHSEQNAMAAKMLDEKGNLKPFAKWVKEIKPIADHYNKQWLQTEYDTAVGRAHFAAQWKQIEANTDVLPNAEWLPTTSVQIGEDHRPFWGTIRPIGDKFWQEHRPQDRWNCKCGIAATDKNPTGTPAETALNPKKNNAAVGLENNPADKGQIFSQKHPYFTEGDTCEGCDFYNSPLNSLMSLMPLSAAPKRHCYNCKRADKVVKTAEKSATAIEREKYLTEMLPLLKIKVKKEVDLCERIRAEVSEIEWIEQDFGQDVFDKWRPKVAFPAVLIDFPNAQYSAEQGASQFGEVTVSIRLLVAPFSQSYADAPLEVKEDALQYFELEQKLVDALHGWMPDEGYCQPFVRESITSSNRNDIGLRIRNLTFSTAYEEDFDCSE